MSRSALPFSAAPGRGGPRAAGRRRAPRAGPPGRAARRRGPRPPRRGTARGRRRPWPRRAARRGARRTTAHSASSSGFASPITVRPACRPSWIAYWPTHAGRAGHGEGGAGRQGQHVQGGAHGQAVHRQRGRLGQRPAVGHLGELVLGDHPVLGLRAAAGHHRGDRGHHPVARVPARHVGAGFLDDAGQVHAGDVRRLDAVGHRPPALPEAEVGRVHGGRRDLHEDLPWPGRRPRHRDDAEHGRVAELGEANGTHVRHDAPPGDGWRAGRSTKSFGDHCLVPAQREQLVDAAQVQVRPLAWRQVVVGVRAGQPGLHRDGQGAAAVRHRHLEQRVVADDDQVPGRDAEPGGGGAQRVGRRLAGDGQAAAGDRPDHRGYRPGGAERAAARRGEERRLRRASTAPRRTRPPGRRPPGADMVNSRNQPTNTASTSGGLLRRAGCQARPRPAARPRCRPRAAARSARRRRAP